jgi:hypothetical protein
MSDTLLANEPEARTPTGEIKDQTSTPPPTIPTPTPTPAEAPAPTKPPAEDDKTLLNQKVPGGAPEKYDFKLPEGATLPEATLTEVSGIFKDLNLSQDQAQKLVDYHVAQAQKLSEAANESAMAIRSSWQAQVKADPDIGPRLPQVRQAISSALDVLGDAKLAQEFRQAMDFTGAGDNPAFVKTLYKLSQLVTEPRRHVAGGGPAATGQRAPGEGKPSAAKALYPNLA